MNQKQLQKWEKTRRKGQKEFVLYNGGILFGLVTFGLILPLVKFIFYFFVNNFTLSFFDRSFTVGIFVGLFLSFPLGCLWGWFAWHLSEWQYKRHLKKTLG